MTQNNDKPFIIKSIPTLLSLLAVWFGITAIRFAFSGDFDYAAGFMLFAAFLDGIDGRVARALGVSSDFGVQIDSLADAINFGVSPAFIIYMWRMNEFSSDKFAWFAALLLISSLIIRLARFNVATTTTDPDSPLVKYFFTGMPAPAVAAMTILPLVVTFQFGEGWWSEPIITILNTILMSIFAASTIPTPCLKKLHFAGLYNIAYKSTLYLILALFILGFIPLIPFSPWLSLVVLGIVYAISIVLSVIAYKKIEKTLK
ncbi:MAG: CDP-diacylglycerol--serine O-phosphatidyltransferase [Rickettsiales bacterium]|nr:MAG: CDP-diacylglycerol--serine O-phosphatidyltransferase [Rickettsiales bacterium]